MAATQRLDQQFYFDARTRVYDQLNRLLLAIEDRIASLELIKTQLGTSVDQITAVALARLDETFTPLILDAQQRLEEFAANFAAHSDTPLVIGLGAKILSIDADQRQGYVFSDYVAIRHVGGSQFMLAQITDYDRPNGQLFVNVVDTNGTGTFADWDVRMTVPPDFTHANRTDNPHATTAAQVGAYTKAEIDAFDYAPLASPALTGVPTAPTPSTADNSTKIATTSFVKQVSTVQSVAGRTGAVTLTKADVGLSAVDNTSDISKLAPYAPLASPAFTGAPTAPTQAASDNSTKIATTAFVRNACVGEPQGRLTLQSGVPVMTTTQSGKTTLFYTPYVGGLIPIWDGVEFIMTDIGAEISALTTDTTKSPAAIGASKINDWFVWNDAGTVRLSHGPDWTSDVIRSGGTGLTRIGGIWVNNASITNGPSNGRGTYVGTTRSNASGSLDWTYGGPAVLATAGFFGVWNMYRRALVTSVSRDTTASWTYGINGWRAANLGNMRCSMVFGQAENAIQAVYNAQVAAGTASSAGAGVGMDFTTTFPVNGGIGRATNVTGSYTNVSGEYAGTPGVGFHFVAAIEANQGGNAATWSGEVTGNGTYPGFRTTFFA